MNKLTIVLLLVCLISVQVNAFVKRDAPAAPASTNSVLDDLAKQFQDFTNKVGTQLKENLNPEKMQEEFNKFQERAKEVIEQLKPKETKA